jgi:hypothetical protein
MAENMFPLSECRDSIESAWRQQRPECLNDHRTENAGSPSSPLFDKIREKDLDRILVGLIESPAGGPPI